MRRLLLPLLLVAAATASATEAVPFIENDYPRAVAAAKSKNLPLFVDAWAPW